MPHLKVIDWFNTLDWYYQLLALAFVLQQICTLIVGSLDQKHADKPIVRIMGHIANAKFADARGTWKWPGLSARDPETRQ